MKNIQRQMHDLCTSYEQTVRKPRPSHGTRRLELIYLTFCSHLKAVKLVVWLCARTYRIDSCWILRDNQTAIWYRRLCLPKYRIYWTRYKRRKCKPVPILSYIQALHLCSHPKNKFLTTSARIIDMHVEHKLKLHQTYKIQISPSFLLSGLSSNFNHKIYV